MQRLKQIIQPFDHSEITLEVAFDKVIRGPGYWKINNSHLKTYDFIKLMKKSFVELVYQNQMEIDHPKTEYELAAMTPEDLQNLATTLNPQELMELLHFTLKAKTIRYSMT